VEKQIPITDLSRSLFYEDTIMFTRIPSCFESGTFTYFKCRQSAMFNSVISPAPEMRLISSSFLPMASAVTADGLKVFREVWDLD